MRTHSRRQNVHSILISRGVKEGGNIEIERDGSCRGRDRGKGLNAPCYERIFEAMAGEYNC
eukprot:scaffold138798_cov27-Tisochrysis_lutea.AAC.2